MFCAFETFALFERLETFERLDRFALFERLERRLKTYQPVSDEKKKIDTTDPDGQTIEMKIQIDENRKMMISPNHFEFTQTARKERKDKRRT